MSSIWTRSPGAVGVIAEINPKAAQKRLEQGWVDEVHTDLDALLSRIDGARRERKGVALAYQGNVVDLWERLARAGTEVELGSDQTSLHIPFTGGYYPAGLSHEESNRMMVDDPAGFKERVHESLENLTPADVYHGRAREILTARARLKARTLRQRKCYNRGQIPRKEELIRPSLFREVSITNRPEMSHSL